MKITELVNEQRITEQLEAKTKADVLNELAALLDRDGKLLDRDVFLQSIVAREQQGSTGIGYGIAIPHGKSTAVKEPAIAFGRSLEGVDFDSLDGQPAKLFFMIAVPEQSDNLHLQTLAKLSRKLMHESFRDELMQAKTKGDILRALSKMDPS
ncbi:PTS sugar transporter subunit IIA [Kroppenstedtia eburnea]|uniref:PTS system D-fructose-specific IIA component (F1P-forming), Frc family n=1 Tax=Kroppenstedtia eburnea TaxID=714067 RepID=A0A1N7MCX8_9BACL|nr:PTS sugar transporter subunit IIA [Kroppenstedtia eburnea]EGK07319.1 PTS family porter [Desmospora sp. 8437]SIS83933.1 PTS system D-fructose-specific IIA component (F1P-forming), Frc family [Kroppenstedtia eburnea]